MASHENHDSADENARNRLNSWKEIAHYLGKGVRTAQRWEKELGLPVHRIASTGREIIFAFRNEIDRWLLASEQARRDEAAIYKPADEPAVTVPVPDGTASTLPEGVTRRQPSYTNPKALWSWASSASALLLVALFVVLWSFFVANRLGAPEQFHINSSTLAVTDRAGRLLWEKIFDAPFLTARYANDTLLTMRPPVWFGDLDSDSRRETVLLYDPVTRLRSGSFLFCFTDRGEEKWRFAPGKAVRDTQKTYDPPFTIQNFMVADIDEKGTKRIVLTSHHVSDYPNRFVVLDGAGNELSEYWHSGFLEHIDLMDLDDDGRQEILLAGVNNGYGSATLVILDSGSLRGASRQAPGDPRQLQGFDLGYELAVLLFPRSCINQRLENYNLVASLVANDDTIRVEVDEKRGDPDSRVTYLLNQSLEVIDASVSDRFKTIHRDLRLSGKLDHDLTGEEIARLRDVRILRNGDSK